MKKLIISCPDPSASSLAQIDRTTRTARWIGKGYCSHPSSIQRDGAALPVDKRDLEWWRTSNARRSVVLSIVDELKSDADTDIDSDLPTCEPDSGYPCLADEWEVKLPTTLVHLQQDSALPDYTLNP
jgi:hypothetical protein